MSKYGNKKTVLYGEEFDSKAEANRYLVLREKERNGEISHLARQKVFVLAPGVVIQGRKRPPLRYKADFVYILRDGKEITEDVKGVVTEGYRIKRHLMMCVHGIEILETK